MNKNKNIVILVIAIVVVVGISLMTRYARMPKAPKVAEEKAAPATEEVVAPVEDKAVAFATVMSAYKDRVVTLADDCSATPAKLSVKAGEGIMIFNNASKERSVTIGDMSYIIGAKKYRTAVLKTAAVLPLSCDAVTSAAEVTVQ